MILNNFKRFNPTTLAGPVLIILILMMMVLPLKPFVLDIFFTFNIAVSIIVLLVAINTRQPLDFSAFPSVLLITTLLRLSLNVASSRIILLEGHAGTGAAGKVIQSFSEFLVGGNVAIGVVVFIILTVINFVVITKGAGRIAEVSARFTLDAMPGKQMAIDADLNAGLIGEEEARKRRQMISEEATLFGSMDGSSKFVRGDAIAGIMIMIINIVGGMVVGVIQHDLPVTQALETYTLLTIGDGLVAQIPSLIISTAAGIVVSRVGKDTDLSEQFMGQLFANSQVMYITAAVMTLIGLIPGMPHLAFLLISAAFCAVGYRNTKQKEISQQNRTSHSANGVTQDPNGLILPSANGMPQGAAAEVSWNDVQPIDPLGLEVGYRLISLVDRSQDGDLLRRIRGTRKKIAQDLGFLLPPVHIRDNLELQANEYRILVKGVEIGSGESYNGEYLAINPGTVMGDLPGKHTTDPAFGLAATWIHGDLREEAQGLGYTVVDASTVIATHMSNILNEHASELLGREEVQALIDRQMQESPKLIEDLVPKVVPIGVLQKVLQGLLSEGIHIRDFRTIIETLADHITQTQDSESLIAAVRVALSRAIVDQLFPGSWELPLLALDPQLEGLLLQAVQSPSGGAIEPNLAENLLSQTAKAAERVEQEGFAAVLLCTPVLRSMLARFLKRAIPTLRVLSHQEIPDNKNIRIVSVIGNLQGSE
jgi:flagellar biosynthesis protein FlhA